MNTFKDAVLNTRAQYLKHMGIADRYHTLWDLLEKSTIAITVVGFLLSTAMLVAGVESLTWVSMYGALSSWFGSFPPS